MLFALSPAVGATPLPPDAVRMTLIPDQIVGRMGYHVTYRAETSATPMPKSVRKPIRGLASPRYGVMTFGPKRVAFAFSGSGGAGARLVVDTNGDGDLSNEVPIAWKTGRTKFQMNWTY